jgi:ABC-2 type transport system permease protein
MISSKNVFRLGVKELWSLVRDPMLLVLIAWTFTVAIYVAATAMPDSLHNAPIAIVDEDASPLSARIVSSFYPPHFMTPAMVSLAEVDAGMDRGDFTFALDIPPNFQKRRAGRAHPGNPAQYRRHAHGPGLHRQRLHPADGRQRGQ